MSPVNETRPTSAGTMPTSTLRNDMNGNAAVDRSSATSDCSRSREPGPATDRPVYSIAQGRTVTPEAGSVRSNQRM